MKRGLAMSDKWESVIGIETHCQLLTDSKMFSDAPACYSSEPNGQACEVDLALPGVLPVPNRLAVEKAIRFGLAAECTINSFSEFARKNYFYPDLPKGYQISQFEHPVLTGGSLEIGTRTVRLTRAHLEEDAGKLVHDKWDEFSGVDLNRAGTPLLEIVTEPDLRSSDEAVDYAKRLHQLVRYINICDGNMQQGSFRCDINVSIRRHGSTEFGTRCEIKNLNSFRFLQQAIEYEIKRQIGKVESGEDIKQETRLFDPSTGKTKSMRSKEEAQDYRYFPDPDLLPLHISEEWIESVRNSMPELPWERKSRYTSQLELSDYDASVLTSDKDLAQFFDDLLSETGVGEAKLCANWVAGEVNAFLNRNSLSPAALQISPARLARLLRRISDKTISNTMAKSVLEEMWDSNDEADAIIERKGLKQIADPEQLEQIVSGIIEANPKQFQQLLEGKDRLTGFFVGQAMKATQGKGDPALLSEIVKRKAKESK